MKHELQTVLNNEIPLTNAIGIVVENCTESSLIISAPLQNNINHKSTAFGGSLYCVSVLTGWGLIYNYLKRHHIDGHIVIHESQTKFLKPVSAAITATCQFESAEQMIRFEKIYKRRGKSRITLNSIITHNGETAVIFTGQYVVHR